MEQKTKRDLKSEKHNIDKWLKNTELIVSDGVSDVTDQNTIERLDKVMWNYLFQDSNNCMLKKKTLTWIQIV